MIVRVLFLAGMLGSFATRATAEPLRAPNCACAGSRLLRHGKTVSSSNERGITAWLDTARDARLVPMMRSDTGDWTSIEIPWRISDYEGPSAYPQGRKRLVHAQSTPAQRTDFFVTLWEKGKRRPSDVVLAQADAGTLGNGASNRPADRQILAMHLGPVTSRSSAACGTYRTLPVTYGAISKQSEPVAFWVEYRESSGAARVELIDARHLRIFGLGRVPACGEGMSLDEGAGGTLVVRAVSRDLVLGPVWSWNLTAEEPNPVPTLVQTPAHADLGAVENPFAAGYRTPMERLLSDDTDHAALGLMVFLITAAIAAAFLIWRLWRHAKPNWVTVTCPACAEEIRLDAAKKAVDGTFCPHCGGSSVFISFSADGQAKAAAFRRRKNK